MSAKKLIPLILSAISISANAYDYSSYSAAYSSADYREAINMGLKFFGGQRCGDSHNWMLVNNSELQKIEVLAQLEPRLPKSSVYLFKA